MSILELMIALALGLFLTAGLISLFVGSKQSYRLNENMARLQENARFAMTFIARDIRMTDYRACLANGRKDDALAGVNGSSSPDSVSLSWQINLCGATGVTRTIVYTIQTGSDGRNALFRSVDGATAEELVQGIEDLQITYGEDTDGADPVNGDYSPSYYVDAGSVADMAKAMSVKFTLTAATLDTNLTAAGGRITRDFTATVALRNRLP